jgi:flagellin
MLTRINTNIMALDAQRNLANNTTKIAQSMARLSSGLRINTAADDPSGLVLSQTLGAQASGLGVVQQNITQGVNLVKTAEGALTEVNSLLQQINDLALAASQDSTNTADSRAALQQQVNSAVATIDGIAANTKYAGVNLLNGSVGDKITINDANTLSAAYLPGTTMTAGAKSLVITQQGVKASATGSVTYTATTDTLATTDTATLAINGTVIGTFTGGTTTVQQAMDAVNAKSATTGVRATFDGTVATPDGIKLQALDYGTQNNFTWQTSDTGMFDATASGTGTGTDATAHFTGSAETFTAHSGLKLASTTNGSSDYITLTDAANSTGGTINGVMTVAHNQASFQVGLSAAEQANISIANMSSTALNINNLDLSSAGAAQTALTTINSAINTVSDLRGRLGAFQSNELESQGRSAAVSSENLAASQSAIQDTDFGAEMAKYATSQILVQSATAFLAQANQMPQYVLQLIRNA